MSNQSIQDQVMAALATVIEPELHRDIVSLNMVRDLTVTDAGVAQFTVVLTTPACPLKDVIYDRARAAVLRVPGITDLAIRWDSNVPTDSRIFGQIETPLRSVIAVSSGKGGVGKSTVAVNLAVALAQSGARVGLMDADILGPNIPKMVGLGFHQPPLTPDQKIVPFQAYGLKVMSMGFLADPNTPVMWRGPMLHGAIRQFFSDVAWGELDYMVVDLPPGTGDAQLSLAQSVPLTGAIIVTQPQSVAIDDARRGLAMFEKLNVPILGVIENMSGEMFGEGGGETFAQERSVPFLGRVPMIPAVRVGGDTGKPVVASDPDSEAARAFRTVAEQVAARVSVQLLASGAAIQLNVIK
ncbi:Mrp/NBP35 family ATP-binding protein [Aggregatilinea lenta]|uniref:Mrp/NBP35 family ATP-binding protein n=1 Tax=Aggregatilinea lenta TaxID=913108 RepID=UPI001EE8131A|nr:Mrp/NBP35 family ATP-binding protein [Aggregatilinea lenta]